MQRRRSRIPRATLDARRCLRTGISIKYSISCNQAFISCFVMILICTSYRIPETTLEPPEILQVMHDDVIGLPSNTPTSYLDSSESTLLNPSISNPSNPSNIATSSKILLRNAHSPKPLQRPLDHAPLRTPHIHPKSETPLFRLRLQPIPHPDETALHREPRPLLQAPRNRLPAPLALANLRARLCERPPARGSTGWAAA